MRPIFASLILLALASAPAHAGFAVCNKTAAAAKVAIGRFNGTDWMSEGWWTVAAGKCQTLVTAPLNARYYYLYASDGGTGVWDGSKGFCVAATGKFTAVGRARCAARGYGRKEFFEVDTGQAPDWMQNLSD
ncbi:MAG TPA: DUF1036 domain-containing protein [Rhizomicrobium sp.]|jgi:uncharacterized membrane protein|nr:DUF1036 domain-containing protein [Rhizomicrobium sp.]